MVEKVIVSPNDIELRLRANGIEPAMAEPPARRPRTADVVQAARAL
jgi:hypothetical protein